MWPWGHLALGYLTYSLVCRARGTRPTPGPVAALLVGTQLADIVDKPLAYWAGVLPGGRTLAHSLLFAMPVVLLVVFVARRRGYGTHGTAFAVGYATHLVGDAAEPLLVGSYGELSFLLWPVLPTVVYDIEPSILWQLSHATVGVAFAAELVVGAITLALWWADGRPLLAHALAAVRYRPGSGAP